MEGCVSRFQILRDHGKAQSYAGKARIFGKRPQLNGAGSGALALVDRVRHIFLGDICFISRVINDNGTVLVGIIDPFLQLCFVDRGAGRIVGEAQIDQIRHFLWQLRGKVIVRRAGHVDHIAPSFRGRVIGACPSRHNIGIHIDRVDRIADRDLIIQCKDFLNIAGITFCTVRHKNLVRLNLAASGLIVVIRNRISQKVITKLWRIAAERSRIRHLIHCAVHGAYHRRGKRLCHVTDAQSDDLLVRVRRRIGIHFLPDR